MDRPPGREPPTCGASFDPARSHFGPDGNSDFQSAFEIEVFKTRVGSAESAAAIGELVEPTRMGGDEEIGVRSRGDLPRES